VPASGTTDTAAGQWIDPADVPRPSEGPGSRIGPYKLMEQIGEGGMGLVFVAEQQQPVRRRVALKIIKPGMDSQQVIARFEAERQALALMDHQNIAKVLDAGTTPSGRPYFVMELVHGIPITTYCDANQLTPRERLELFVPVCLAIQHAHQKGIIHRDIKPSNVLVTMYDDKPVPKIIDFGVAKAIEQRLTEKTVYTQFGMLVGTFEYMSPEQAEMNAFGVDTRSDIYSLGVLLYELLTGTTPLEQQRLKQAAFSEIVRLIKEEEPPRPSVRLSTSGALAKVAAARKTDAAKLSRLVRGELDWVVMKCLEKQRTRRYDSAGGLARDVERYLNDEPIEARPPSAWYLFEKFARRNKVALLTAALVAAALVLGTAVSVWQALRATAAEGEARRNEETAQDQKRAADDAKQEAEKRGDELTALNDTLRRANYIADMNLARVSWDENNLARGRELLDKHRPRPREKDLRGFEWHYLNRLLHGQELIVKAHGDRVTAIAFTPDGKRLISSGHSEPPGAMHFDFAERGSKGEVKQWDAATGRPLPFQLKGTTGGTETLTVFGDRVAQMALSRDGTRMAATCGDRAIRVLEFATGKLTLLEGPVKHIASLVRFSPDGQHLLSVHRRDVSVPIDSPHSIRVWDLATRKAIVTVNQLSPIRTLPSFSPDGRHFAVCFVSQRVVKVLETATGAEAYSCSNAGENISFPVFSPDGKRLAVCLRNGVQIWDTATHRPVLNWALDAGHGSCLTFSPDGKRLATGSVEGVVEVWETGPVQKIHSFKGHAGVVMDLTFSPDGMRLVTGGADGTLRWWGTTKRRDTISIPNTESIRDLSPDGQTVITTAIGGGAKEFRLWNTQTGEPRGGPIHLPQRSIDKAWTADGQRLYIPDLGRNVTVVDSATGQVIRTFQVDGEANDWLSFALTPNEKWYAHDAGPMGRAIKVRNARTGAEFRSLKGFNARVHALLFSADGSRLFGADRDGVLKIWDTESGGEIATTKLTGIYVGRMAFSPDGKHVAVVGNLSRLLTGEVRILDSESLREVWSLQGHTLNVTAVVFSPDGQRLATASADGAIRVWDLTMGQEILKLSVLSFAKSLGFNSDGRRLISASEDGTVRIWDATPLPE
ncbi:MAG TPA: protein kinase, partial [Gemmataceae bacterium]|nr:protein kinase [Gemmataceae bacterium]